MKVALVAALALALLGAAPVLAQTPSGYPCGRVNAYTAPTANSSGSITIGTSTFELAPGSAPAAQPAVGSDLCIHGDRNATGVFVAFTVSPMGEGTCGVVSAFTPATATARGSITIDAAGWLYTLPVGPGVTLTTEQTTGGQCFLTQVSSDGNAQVRGYSGPWEAAATPPPAASQLPSTSTMTLQGSLALLLTAFAAAGALSAMLARRR